MASTAHRLLLSLMLLLALPEAAGLPPAGGAALAAPLAAAPLALPRLAECPAGPPLHLVIGATTWRSTPERVRANLGTVLGQLREFALQPGSPGLRLSLFPLTARELDAQPLRAETPCLPLPPAQPDATRLGSFERRRALAEYAAAVERLRQARQQAAVALDDLDRQLQEQAWPAVPPSIWAYLTLASREFASHDATRRYIVLVAFDESDEERIAHPTYDFLSLRLGGATVLWLGFDRESPEDQRQRASEWSCWLYTAGAGPVLFFRSNELIPPLFGPEPPPASFQPSDFDELQCRW